MPEHYKSIGDYDKSYKELQRMKGAPGAEATQEQINAFRSSHGVPEVVNSQAYGIELPKELQEIYKPESIDQILKVANENAHLGHVEMMKAVFSEFGQMEMKGIADHTAATEAEKAAKLQEDAKMLEADPSFAGDKKQAALQTSANALNAALDSLGVDPKSEEALEVARSPLMVRILHHFGSKTSQDGVNLGPSNADLRSNEEIANDIMENPNNPEHALYKSGDERVGKKVLRLMGAEDI